MLRNNSNYKGNHLVRKALPVKLKLALELTGLTRTQLVKLANLSPTAVSNYLHRSMIPNPESMKRICSTLGCSEAWLVNLDLEEGAPTRTYGLAALTKDQQNLLDKQNAALRHPSSLPLLTAEQEIEAIRKRNPKNPTAPEPGTGLDYAAYLIDRDPNVILRMREYPSPAATFAQKEEFRHKLCARARYLENNATIAPKLQQATQLSLPAIYKYIKGELFPRTKSLFLLARALRWTPEQLDTRPSGKYVTVESHTTSTLPTSSAGAPVDVPAGAAIIDGVEYTAEEVAFIRKQEEDERNESALLSLWQAYINSGKQQALLKVWEEFAFKVNPYVIDDPEDMPMPPYDMVTFPDATAWIGFDLDQDEQTDFEEIVWPPVG